jgi:monothiol glutaredoxin
MTRVALPEPVRARVEAAIARAPIVLFALGPVRAPRTGTGARIVHHIEAAGALGRVTVVDLVEDRELREAVQVWTDSSDLPLLFVRGTFVGGARAIDALAAAGTLTAAMGS